MWLEFDNAPKDHLKKHFEVLKHKISRDIFTTFNLKYSEESSEIVNVVVKIHLQTNFFASPFKNYNFVQKKINLIFQDVVSIQIDGSDKTWADVSKKSLNVQKPDSNSTMPLNFHTYNPISFDMNSKNARYFVIKSFSEDDVHRSIKYGIWCSTDHGNKRLDAAFKAQKSAAIGYSKISRISNPFSIIKAKVVLMFFKRRKFLVTVNI